MENFLKALSFLHKLSKLQTRRGAIYPEGSWRKTEASNCGLALTEQPAQAKT
ncbi:unnamed protein product, partial [Nesidiocoris tenuis]